MSDRTLILGGAGFLGGHICAALRERGGSVRIFDRVRPQGYGARSSGVEVYEGDFASHGDLVEALAGCDTVIHLISTTVPKTSNEDPAYDVQSNVVPTLRFLDVARQTGVKKIVFASSGGTIYGAARTLPIPEHHETVPLCSYGIQKLAIERYLELYFRLYGIDYCILRMSNPYGEGQRQNAAQGAVTVFLDKAIRGETIEVWGDGSVVRDYVYARDVGTAFSLATRHEGLPKVFNIGSGQGLSLNELLGIVESLLGRPIARRYVTGRRFDVPANVLDISSARAHLHWRPVYTFHQGLEKTLEWLQSAQLSATQTSLP